MTPRFSVIIPLYNKERQIGHTLDSVLTQSVTDCEVIVVDDGSTDGSAAVVQAYDDSRIRYVAKDNGGVSAARNRGTSKARGEWLVWLDADDTMCPNALEAFVRLSRRWPEAKIVVGAVTTLLGDQRVTQVLPQVKDRLTHTPYFSHWMNRLYPRPGAVAVRRSVVQQVGGYDERMAFYEDYEFGLRLLGIGAVAYTTQRVVTYHVEPCGLSQSRHAPEREMSYYIDELLGHGFWHRALLYENIEAALLWWQDDADVTHYYATMRKRCFSWIDAALHWARQKMVRRGLIRYS